MFTRQWLARLFVLVVILVVARPHVMTIKGTLPTPCDGIYSPDWFPDGTRIVFVTTCDRKFNGFTPVYNPEIFVMNSDGTDIRRLTSNETSYNRRADEYPVWSPDGKRIAFVSDWQGNDDIYIMNADGTNVRNITNTSIEEKYPAWSPNGKQLVFVAQRDLDLGHGLYIVNIDGTNARFVTKTSNDTAPDWSPDGKLMAFDDAMTDTKQQYGGNLFGQSSVYVIAPDGTGRREVAIRGGNPQWSRDGKQLVFIRYALDAEDDNGEANLQVFTVNADGSGLRDLISERKTSSYHARWLPDGKSIAWLFTLPPDKGKQWIDQLYIMNVDGSNKRPLDLPQTFTSYALTQPGSAEIAANNASPNTQVSVPAHRQTIAFQTFRDGNDEIYITDLQGSYLRNLTQNPAYDGHPAWSPDGTQIAFLSNRDSHNNLDLYVMNADGSSPRRLTRDSTFYNGFPAWSPDGRWLAFHSVVGTSNQLFIVAVDGSQLRRLTHDSDDNTHPAWSPDGTQLVFGKVRERAFWELCLMKPDGTQQNCFVKEDYPDYPMWAPDGRRLAFERSGDFTTIVILDLATMQTTRIKPGTNDKPIPGQVAYFRSAVNASWSPDGQWLALVIQVEGQYDLYIADKQGSNLRNLTNTTNGHEFFPTWLADGSELLFFARGEVAGKYGVGAFRRNLRSGKVVPFAPFQGNVPFNLSVIGAPPQKRTTWEATFYRLYP